MVTTSSITRTILTIRSIRTNNNINTINIHSTTNNSNNNTTTRAVSESVSVSIHRSVRPIPVYSVQVN